MKKKLLKIALVGNTNVGKSSLINVLVGEKISIINKKINTTQEQILGIINKNEVQLIFYDTPGSNFLKTKDLMQKKLKINIWNALDSIDLILYIVDSKKFNISNAIKDIKKISEVGKNIIFVFNKTDLIDNNILIPYIKELENIKLIETYFNISAKYNIGVEKLCEYLFFLNFPLVKSIIRYL